MRVLAIDPGSTESALVEAQIDRDGTATPWGIKPTYAKDVANGIARSRIYYRDPFDVLCIETMPTVFQGAAARDQLTAERWAGRFIEAHTYRCEATHAHPVIIQVARASAKAATIGRARGTDSELRRSLIDAYGGDDRAFGAKCKPCRGRGWRGAGRPTCDACGGSGWRVPEGPLAGFKGSHVFAGLALLFAAFEPGGLYDKLREGQP